MLKLFAAIFAQFLALAVARQFDYGCNDKFDHLSVGHIHLTDKNYAKFKKEVMLTSKVFILGASDSSCDQCCFTEALLDNLKILFDAKKYTGKVNHYSLTLFTQKGSLIQIARVDMAMRYDFLASTGIQMTNVPAVYVFYDGKYYIHDLDSTEGNIEDPTTIMHLVNKLVHPFLQLDSEEAVDRFLNLAKEPEETTALLKKYPPYLGRYYDDKQLKTRALLLIFNKDDYDQEIDFLKEAARNSARRESLRFGIVSDPSIVRLYKKKYGEHWFGDSVQFNGFIVKRYDGTIFAYNMLEVNSAVNMQFFVNKKSILAV